MEIVFESREFTPTEKYLMTKSPSITSVKEVEDGKCMLVKGYLQYIDKNQKGEETRMTSIIGVVDGAENVVWSTHSQTFIQNFIDISEIFDGEEFTIKKLSGVTKNQKRPYVNCDLAQ